MASKLVSLGESRKIFPKYVIKTSDNPSLTATQGELIPPIFMMSPRMKRTPSSTIPALSQNS